MRIRQEFVPKNLTRFLRDGPIWWGQSQPRLRIIVRGGFGDYRVGIIGTERPVGSVGPDGLCLICV
jgi:hypothetical protein